MRLFIASPVTIYDHQGIKSIFSDTIAGKWVDEANLHLTWCFLGDVEDPEMTIKRLQRIKPPQQEIEIRGLGLFGRPARIFFAKAESEALYSKAEEFKSAHFDLSRFKPHITLCRIKKVLDTAALSHKVDDLKTMVLGVIKPEIHLYRSVLTEKSPVYTKIYTVH